MNSSRSRFTAAAIAVILSTAVLGVIRLPVAAYGADCTTPALLTAAGSGQGNKVNGFGAEMAYLASQVRRDATNSGSALDVTAIDYPASPWPYVHRGIAWDWNTLETSELVGVQRMQNAIVLARQGCPRRPILLAGYSQGADVVTRVINSLSVDERSTVSAALLGNPSFLPLVPGDYGNFDPKRRGIRQSLFQKSFRTPADVLPRVFDACLHGDAVCNYNTANALTLGTGKSSHYQYVQSGYAITAAHALWKSRAAPALSLHASPESGPAGTIFKLSGDPCNMSLFPAGVEGYVEFTIPNGNRYIGVGSTPGQQGNWWTPSGTLPLQTPTRTLGGPTTADLPPGRYSVIGACRYRSASGTEFVTQTFTSPTIRISGPSLTYSRPSTSTGDPSHIHAKANAPCPAGTQQVRFESWSDSFSYSMGTTVYPDSAGYWSATLAAPTEPGLYHSQAYCIGNPADVANAASLMYASFDFSLP
jgi:hypothetical protein